MTSDSPSRRRSLDWGVAAFLVALVVVIALAVWLWRSSSRLSRAAEALEEGDIETATPLLEAAAGGWYGRARAEEGLAILAFHSGDAEAGRAHLERAKEAGGGSILDEPVAVLERMVRWGDYPAAEAWAAYLEENVDSLEPGYWRAAALAGLHRGGEARAKLDAFRAAVGPVGTSAWTERISALRPALDRLERGRFFNVVDRERRPVHGFDPESGEPVAGSWPLSSLTGAPASDPGGGVLEGRDIDNEVVLTIESAAQRAAHKALGRWAGGLVLLDVRTGEILAAVSHPPGPAEGEVLEEEIGGEPPWTAFRHQYGAGSIVKLMTWSAALRAGSDLDRIFPLICRGNNFIIDGEILYDWRPHGTVETAVEATAVSCNTAFGKTGFLVGEQALADEFLQWRFEAPLELALAPAETGHTWKPPLGSDWELARAAIGLGHATMTVLHGALLAGAVANDGLMARPRLLLEKRNVLGGIYEQTAPGEMGRVASPLVMRELRAGMEAAVTMKEGTAARLGKARVSMAVKTGTSGNPKDGLDSILVGYMPAEQPRFAFALVLEKGGLAGLEGAKVMLQFLDYWYERGGGVETTAR